MDDGMRNPFLVASIKRLESEIRTFTEAARKLPKKRRQLKALKAKRADYVRRRGSVDE
jgi:hypothetical protein